MKKVIIAALMAATILPQALTARAEIFSRDALGGAVLGGVAGGIIGHNSGRRTAEGIGIGAGAGLLMGGTPANVLTSTPVVTQTVQQPAPQQVTVINNYDTGPTSPMSTANALFGR
jgi:outer membrane lipoprotein SlyB